MTMERKDIEKCVNEVICTILGIDGSEIRSDGSLESDYGADSLDNLEIIMELEKEFSIHIPDDILFGQDDVTVGQIYDFVEKEVS